jgi:hypothetical protein
MVGIDGKSSIKNQTKISYSYQTSYYFILLSAFYFYIFAIACPLAITYVSY